MSKYLEIINITNDNSIKASFRKGDLTYAVGGARFHVISWPNHRSNTYRYDEIAFVTAASKGNAFFNGTAPQEFSKIEITFNTGQILIIESEHNDLTEFYEELVRARHEAITKSP